MKAALAVDLGGTRLRVAVVNQAGEFLYQEQRPTPATRPAILAQLGTLLQRARDWATAQGYRVQGIGISTGGRVDFARGEVLAATALLPDWRRVPLRDWAMVHLELPAWVDNDGNCAALGELWWGAGRDCHHFLSVVVGTGIGGGVVLNGQVVRGTTFAAGELGHISVDYQGPPCTCGNWGCVELFASGSGLANLAQTLWEAGVLQLTHKTITSSEQITAQELGVAARLGNPVAQDLIQRAGRILGTALTSVIHAFNPERVIVGGSVLALGDDYWQPLVTTVHQRAMAPVTLVRSPLPEAALLGAAALVWQNG